MPTEDAHSTRQPIRSFRNDPADFLPEALGGFVASHPDAEWHDSGFIARRSPVVTLAGDPAVSVISGGGSGHEPMHAGFLGAGMLSAVCPGLMFTSPNAVQITEATRWADQGAGVLHVVKNYTGDVMNFTVARQAVEDADNSRSMAVALAPGHLPTSGRDTFDLNEGAMEVGVGIHGERGVSREGVARADTIVDRLLSAVTEALAIGTAEGAAGTGSRDEVICLVNGLGGTTPLELSLVYGSALRWLADHGITVRRGIVGTLVTSVNMAGVSLTLTRATDEVVDLLDATTDAPAWPRVLGTEAEYAPASMSFDDDMPTSGGTNEWLSGVVERVKGATDDLTELDRLAGDGDFGTNMDAAFGEVSVPVKGEDAEVLQALSHRLFIRAGGTSGAVLGTLFRELAAAMRGDTADADATPAQRLATGLTRAHEAITELGGAKQGDNTLVDALIPAAEAVNGAAKNAPDDMEGALAAGYSAAEKGALSTREMVAKKGRASYLGDASKGVVDPGAIVVAWIFGGSGKVSDFTS